MSSFVELRGEVRVQTYLAVPRDGGQPYCGTVTLTAESARGVIVQIILDPDQLRELGAMCATTADQVADIEVCERIWESS